MIDLLQAKGAEYAIKVPFYAWIGLKDRILANRVWGRVANGIDCFEEDIVLEQWDRCLRVVIYRKRVGHRSPKNYQLDLFDPSDGHWEYSAAVTNKTLTGRNLWYYMCGRGCHEKILAEIKGGYAFDRVPTMKYAANGAWQILSVLAFNLMRGMQAITSAPTREIGRSRSYGFVFETIHTIRYSWLRRAGIVARPAGRAVLDVGMNETVRQRFEQIAGQLAEAA